tara:strand:+ start:641 stop:1324 length:684 start_codon:yes stop_codon:yes gene_type:complete
LQITCNNNKPNITLIKKINNFKESLKTQSFILLARPKDIAYTSNVGKKKFIKDLSLIVEKGLLILEIPWVDNENWLDFMSDLKSRFPHLKIGSASLINKKSIDDSIKLDLNFSMMRFWNKDLYIYSKKKNYLLIPGMTSFQDFKEAISFNCCMIKVFPVAKKDIQLDINKFNRISFLGAGDIGINDINKFKSLGYLGVVVGRKGYDGEKFDPEIFKILNSRMKKISK